MTSLIVSSPLMANSPGGVGIPNTQYAAVGSSNAPPQIQEIANKLQQMQLQRSFNFEVVDDTALIDTSLLANPKINHKQTKINAKKKPKLKPRKDWRKKKTLDAHRISADKETTVSKYSRAEMLALSLQNMQHQKNKWAAVYGGLAASVAAEYDGLVAASPAVWKNYGVPAFDFRRRPLLDNFDAAAAAAMGKRSPLKILVL